MSKNQDDSSLKDTINQKNKNHIASQVEKKVNDPTTVTVSFPDEGLEVSVSKGSTILDAAIAAGVFINSVCGGVGRCGKCKIQAVGDVDIKKTELISDKESADGLSLACTTTVLGDVEIKIPDTSKVSIHQILTKCELVDIAKPEPLIHKFHLKLDSPNLENNLSDLARVKHSLLINEDLKEYSADNISISIGLLKKLPVFLRQYDWDITVTLARLKNCGEIINLEAGNTTQYKLGLCVDIGTTTIVVELVDLNTGKSLGCMSNYNKQKICGEDVLSRIIYSEEHGVEKLQELVIEDINYLINELISEENNSLREIDKNEICHIVLAGNTTMTHMFLGMDPSSIRRDPYIPTVSQVPILKARELKLQINPEAMVYCFPSRASWVGGDITADILSSNMHRQDELSMLIDVGTNGEVVLGNKDWLIACSCSAGPAFEGGEVQFGMNASSGAIEKVQLTDDLEVKYKTIANTKPKGVCGSGLIDVMSELFTHKVIDRNGHFKKIKTQRLKEVDGEPVFIIVFAENTGFEDKKDIFITETDIKNILRTKAAVYAACHLLLKTLGYTFDDLKYIYIAGGFGNYLDTKKSIMLGLLPDVPLEKFKYIGNGSLSGSYLALISNSKVEEAEGIYEKMTYIELSVRNDFYNEFVSALFLPHTDISLFPSVKKIL